MASWMGYFTGRKDSKSMTREAIVGSRQQLIMLEKKEKNLNDKIEEEQKKARENVLKNKPGLLYRV